MTCFLIHCTLFSFDGVFCSGEHFELIQSLQLIPVAVNRFFPVELVEGNSYLGMEESSQASLSTPTLDGLGMLLCGVDRQSTAASPIP